MRFSNTQVTAFNTCQKQHDFMYNMELERSEKSMPLYRGIIGHRALESYYKSIHSGCDISEAYESAKKIIIDEINRLGREEPWNIGNASELILIEKRIKAYSEYYEQEPFEIVHVEKAMVAPIYADVDFLFIPDMIVRMTKGQYKGELALYDHKFVYNFYTHDELKLGAQLPKYKKALSKLGYDIKLIYYNQIRTRDFKWKIPSEIFRRSESLVTDEAGEQMWFEQIETIKRINSNTYPVRALASMACKGCWFKEPCYAQMEGRDISDILKFEYKKRERPLKEIFND